MRRLGAGLLFIVTFALAHEALALNISGEQVVIPVIGRFPGAGGTQWQTDVFIANPGSGSYELILRFYPADGLQQRTVTMAPFSVVTLTDICLNLFGRSNTGGMLELDGGPYTLQARARIYNVGNPAGQFGQSVPGIGRFALGRQAFMYGLASSAANRLNVGVANPGDVPARVDIFVRNAAGESVGTREVTVQPKQYTQINDIANALGIPHQDGLSVDMISAELIYGYVSDVRNDTGDAVFVFGLSPNL
jgi:hypothetical protein